MPKHTAKKKISSSHTIFETAPKALAIMLLSGLLILFISTFFALQATSPYDLARPLALASLYIGTAIGGIFCSLRLDDGDSHIAALCASSAMALLIFTVKLILPQQDNSLSAGLSAVLHLLLPAASAMGVLIGNRRPRMRKKRKR